MKTQITKLSKEWTRTELTSLLGIEYPFIQGPLGGFHSERLAAAVSNFGGLGSFGAHSLAPEAIKDVIAELRVLTTKPFAINLWVSMEDEGAWSSDAAAFQRSLAPLTSYIKKLGGTLPTYWPYAPIKFEDQARVLIDAKVPVFSFICGIPPKEILDECRAKRILTIGTATTSEEAIVLEQAGVDAVVASGFEAGGHRGSFLRRAEESLMGTFSLIPQIADVVNVPVIAAGGIGDARGVIAAFALGADGVQMGTAFLASEESGVNPYHRKALLSGRVVSTDLTKAFTGRWARGICNQLMRDLNNPTNEILPYPLQRGLVKNVTQLADQAGEQELMIMWAGQSVNLTRSKDATQFLRDLVSDLQTN